MLTVADDDCEDPFPRGDLRIDYLAPQWPNSDWISLYAADELVEYERSEEIFSGRSLIARWSFDGFLRTRAAKAVYPAEGSRRHVDGEIIPPKYWAESLLGGWDGPHWQSGEARVEIQDGPGSGAATFYDIAVFTADLKECVADLLIARHHMVSRETSAVDWIKRQRPGAYNMNTGWQAYKREIPNHAKESAFREDWKALHPRGVGRPKKIR